jgi:hypothetical protein
LVVESSKYPTPYGSNPLINPIPSVSNPLVGGAGAGRSAAEVREKERARARERERERALFGTVRGDLLAVDFPMREKR